MRRVTQPPHIAGPLAFIDNNLRDSKGHFYNDLSNVTTPSQSWQINNDSTNANWKSQTTAKYYLQRLL